MLSKDVISILVSKSSVAELGLWRQTSRSLRDLVMVEEWNRYMRRQPEEKVEYLCHIAILITENPEYYRNNEVFKKQLQRLAHGVFPNKLIAALTMACLSRIMSTSIQALNDWDLSSLSPIVLRSIKVVAGEKSNRCTLAEVVTAQTPVLARFCARILGLRDYDIENLIQRLPEGIAFDPLIKIHPDLLLPVLLSRIDDVAVFEEICSRIFGAEEEMVDPPMISASYLRPLQRVVSYSLSSSQSVIALQIILGKLPDTHLIANLCQDIDSKNIAGVAQILLDFIKSPKADSSLRLYLLDIISYQLLADADACYVQPIFKQLIPILKDNTLSTREAVLRGLIFLRHHLTADHSAMLIPNLLPLTTDHQDSFLLRLPLLTTLIQYMDDVTVQAFLSQSLVCLSQATREDDIDATFPVLTILLEHPAIDKKMAVPKIASIMLEKVSFAVSDLHYYTSKFIDYVVPLYDPDSEKFVLPFLRALFHAYHWTSELSKGSIPANLENAANYIVLHSELNHNVECYPLYIKKLAPKLSDSQARQLWCELEGIGKMDGHPVDITFAQVLIEKLTKEQQQDAKSLILNNVYPDVLENAYQALLYLRKTGMCSIDEIDSVLQDYWRADGVSLVSDHTKNICQGLTELGAIDYLRKVFATTDVFVRARALPGIVRLLPQCSQSDVMSILEDFNSELQGQRRYSPPEMQLQTANALNEVAKVYPMNFKERLFSVLLMRIKEAEPRVCASLYKALATSLSVLEAHEQTPYIQEILPLLSEGTQRLVTIFAMVYSLPNLITKLEAGSLDRILDTLTRADPQADNEIAKALEIMINLFTQEDKQSALQTIANHPHARILCGFLLPVALLPEPASSDKSVQ